MQTLSLFAAFLGWVRPSVPNYELCNRIRGIILRLLDQTLDGPSTAPGSSQADATAGIGVGLDVSWCVADGEIDGKWAADFLDFDLMGNGFGNEDWATWDSTVSAEWAAPWVGLA